MRSGTFSWSLVNCVTLFLFVVACAAPAIRAQPAAPARPNVLFILADQWRACSTGYAGDANVKTPNLDRLASTSVNFVNAVSGCPVCSPCRASLLTGQRPDKHGIFINDAHLSDDAVTLGKVLAAAGYDTGIIGKWHLNGRGRMSFIPTENRQGFAYWRVMECTHDYNRSFYFADGPERLRWEGYDAFAQTADARRYVRDHAKGSKPFALMLWWGPPHNPYETAPAEFKQLYDPAKLQLRPNVPEAFAEKARKDLAGYYAHCTALDRCIGELCDALRDAGIADDTILVFSSDHGDMLSSHGMQRKQKPYDESLRVPMLWRYPAALGPQGKRLEAVMSTEDVMPTILGFCGVAIPKSVEGRDYSAHMNGGPSPSPENAAVIDCVAPFGEWNRLVGGKEYRGLRTARYTYVRDLKGPWLLFDDEQDPYQQNDLVNKPEFAAIQSQLDTLLAQRLKAAGDEFLPADAYLTRWGYKDRLDKTGTLPTQP